MLTDRYPIPGQMRLDESEDAAEGRCIDTWRERNSVQHFYFRNAAGDVCEMVLHPSEVRLLRDGCNRILLAHGVEREATVQVPA